MVEYLTSTTITTNPDLPANEQAKCPPYNKKWEIPADQISFGNILMIYETHFIYNNILNNYLDLKFPLKEYVV